MYSLQVQMHGYNYGGCVVVIKLWIPLVIMHGNLAYNSIAYIQHGKAAHDKMK